jgi:hypothetical protein
MSSYAYGALTRRREQATPLHSLTDGTDPPGVGSYVDAMAAIVPAEVLAVHAAIIPMATETTTVADKTVTTITEPGVLIGVFIASIVLSMGFFLAGRKWDEPWNGLDWARLAIPPLAFVVWTMLQKTTAFDAVAPGMDDAPRFAIAILAAATLGLIAGFLAKKADAQQSRGNEPEANRPAGGPSSPSTPPATQPR